MKYYCEICGRNHEAYFGIDAPKFNELDINHEISYKEYEGIYLVDKYIYTKGKLELHNEFEQPFVFVTWVSIIAQKFFKKIDAINNDRKLTIEGELLLNLVPIYEIGKGLKIEIEYDLSLNLNEYPKIKVIEESVIKSDQESLTSKSKFLNLMNKFYH